LTLYGPKVKGEVHKQEEEDAARNRTTNMGMKHFYGITWHRKCLNVLETDVAQNE
jgi:hypothetical protein